MTRKPWTAAQVRKLRKLYPHMLTVRVARTLRMSLQRVYNKAHHLGLHKTPAFLASNASGRLNAFTEGGKAHRFLKGLTPWNKGRRGYMGANATSFRKGQMPHNHVAVGTKVKDSEGYWKVKVGEPKQWKYVHRLNWERRRGAIPKGASIVFKNGNKDDCRLANLELLTRAQLMKRNTYHRYPKEIALAIQLRGALQRQINKREGKHERQHDQRSS